MMHSEKNTGIHLASHEYTPLKVATSGVYWDADFQNLLRSQEGSDRARFFPRAELSPNGVLFSLTDQGRELAADSKPMTRRKLPPRELDRFVDAMMNFQKLADVSQTTSQAPPPDPTKIAFIKTFRLPDPDLQPESYRLAGPWFDQRLIVLWGYDRQPGGGSFPANDAQEIRRRLLPYVDRHHGLRRLSASLLHVAAAVLLIFLVWTMFRSVQPPAELCPVCQEKLTAKGACQNRCAQCGEHLRSGQCPSCRPRGQHLTVAPRQAIMTGDIVTAWADQPGHLAVDGHARRQVTSANDKVHCRFPLAGDYAITWEPEAGELNGEFVRLSVRAPLSAEQPAAPFQAVLLLHPNPAAPGQAITAIDASFTDIPGRSIARRDIQWGDQAAWQTLAEAGSRSFPTPGRAQVTLRVTDDTGAVASSTVTLVVTDQPIEPTAELDVTPTSCRPGEIVLARDLSPDWHESAEIQREISWGDGDAFAPMPGQEARHVFTKPGSYQVTLRRTDSNRRTANATKTVTVQADIKPDDDADAGADTPAPALLCRLTLTPDIALVGEHVTATDVSGHANVARRQIRWTAAGDYEDFTPAENALVNPERQNTFASPGHYEVTLKLTLPDQRIVTDTRQLEVVQPGQKGLAPRQPVFVISKPDVSNAGDASKRLTYTINAASNADTVASFHIDDFTVGGRPARIDGRQASIVISTGGQHDVRAQVTYQTTDGQTKTIPLAGKQLRTVIIVD